VLAYLHSSLGVLVCLFAATAQIFDLDGMEMIVDYLRIREGWERARAQAEDEVRQDQLQKALDDLREEQNARKARLGYRTIAALSLRIKRNTNRALFFKK